jgi:hypothetical protein
MNQPDQLLAPLADDNPAIWPLHVLAHAAGAVALALIAMLGRAAVMCGVAILAGLALAAGTKMVWRH